MTGAVVLIVAGLVLATILTRVARRIALGKARHVPELIEREWSSTSGRWRRGHGPSSPARS